MIFVIKICICVKNINFIWWENDPDETFCNCNALRPFYISNKFTRFTTSNDLNTPPSRCTIRKNCQTYSLNVPKQHC